MERVSYNNSIIPESRQVSRTSDLNVKNENVKNKL